MLLKVTLFQAQPVTLSLRRLLPRRLLGQSSDSTSKLTPSPVARIYDNLKFHGRIQGYKGYVSISNSGR